MSLFDKILPELLEIIDDYKIPKKCCDCGVITFEILTCSYVYYHHSCYNCVQKCNGCDIFIKRLNLSLLLSPYYACGFQKSCRNIHRACVFVRPDNSHLYYAPGYKCDKCEKYYCSTCMNNTEWDDVEGPILCNYCDK